jgi:predicted glycogen debranching enzyme
MKARNATPASTELPAPIALRHLSGLNAAISREWLVTNGLGGYASGTLAGVNTRRYHGLLVAALRPPLERTVMVAKLDVTAVYGEKRFELATNEYADGTIVPRGYALLAGFRLEGAMPVWSWQLDDALLEQRIWMTHAENTTYVEFTVVRAAQRLSLEIVPLCTYRDYHWQLHGRREMAATPVSHGVSIEAHSGAARYRILAERGECRLAPDWYWNFKHRAESERGLDDTEDLFRPALFALTLEPGAASAVILTAENRDPVLARDALAHERARQEEFLKQATAVRTSPAWARQLVLAADQFIVERHDSNGNRLGSTVIAGYPWFGDWGRDTMIALPGLTLSTGRPDIARSVLETFACFVSEGMLPNRFPDAGEAPEYNTVDATLWFFVAIDEYVRHSGDVHLLDDLYPTLQSIVAWHRHGTRFGIQVDLSDGLLRAGEPTVQLTWMDAKIGDWVVTPRTGKAVEINALWFNALRIMADFARTLRDAQAANDYDCAAATVARSFNERFWFAAGGYLYDVVDGPDGDDTSLRPNQILAVSLRHALLDASRAKAVVDVCERELVTPVGLRSLAARAEPRYTGRYSGSPHQRDAAYHQGTVWSWLLGPFATAHYNVYGDAARACAFLNAIDVHLREGCIGQVSEIFDADPPFTARGCYAQAWGVAATLRAWSQIDEQKNSQIRREERRHAQAI